MKKISKNTIIALVCLSVAIILAWESFPRPLVVGVLKKVESKPKIMGIPTQVNWYYDGKDDVCCVSSGLKALIQDYCKKGAGTTTYIPDETGVRMETKCSH